MVEKVVGFKESYLSAHVATACLLLSPSLSPLHLSLLIVTSCRLKLHFCPAAHSRRFCPFKFSPWCCSMQCSRVLFHPAAHWLSPPPLWASGVLQSVFWNWAQLFTSSPTHQSPVSSDPQIPAKTSPSGRSLTRVQRDSSADIHKAIKRL